VVCSRVFVSGLHPDGYEEADSAGRACSSVLPLKPGDARMPANADDELYACDAQWSDSIGCSMHLPQETERRVELAAVEANECDPASEEPGQQSPSLREPLNVFGFSVDTPK
jgi:hypothetical protein